MATTETQRLIGHRLVDKDGAAVGKIGQVFFDDQTDVAKWITVRTGLFGSRENLVPLVGAEMAYDSLQVPWSRNKIKGAPSFDLDQHISAEQEDRVYAHYGLNPEIPGQRIPEQAARPRGKHARPEPGEFQPTGSPAWAADEQPHQGDLRTATRYEAAAQQTEPQPIWEPSGERPQPGEAEAGRLWEGASRYPQDRRGDGA